MDDQHENPYRSFGGNAGDYDSPAATEAFDDGTIPRSPKVIGMLNIVFGVLLGLCGLCQGLMIGGSAFSGPQFLNAMQEEQDAMADQIETLQVELEAADDATSEAVQKQIDDANQQLEILQSMPNPMKMWGLDQPRVLAFFGTQCVVNVLLNLLLFISGIGLLSYSEWGRKMGLWVAGLKLVNLIIVAIVMVVLVAPAVANGMQDFMADIAEQQGQAEMPPPEEIGQSMTFGMMIQTAIGSGLAAIYPIICLWQLSRSQVKRACQ